MIAVSGMTLGLNSLEFNLCLKGDDLEGRTDTIDWSSFLRDGNVLKHQIFNSPSVQLEGSSQASLASLLDQVWLI